MYIIFVITGLDMGGAEKQVCKLADKLSSRGYKVKIAYILKPVVVHPQSDQVKLEWLGGDKSLRGSLAALLKLFQIVKIEKPDVIHSHMFHANIMARIAKLFCKMPMLVCTAHSTNEGSWQRMLMYRATNFLGDVFTNVSIEAVKVFEKKRAVAVGKMLNVYNGINTDAFCFKMSSRLKIREDLNLKSKKVFLAIGRLHASKDYYNLISAFKKIVDKHSNSFLLIVGEGELRFEIEQLILSYELTNEVRLLGIRHDIPDLLSSADIFVLSSAWEGFGLVVAEAMACERLIVATDCGGVAEVVGNKKFLVPVRDVVSLANALDVASQINSADSEKIGLELRKRIVENFSLESAVNRWEIIYSSK